MAYTTSKTRERLYRLAYDYNISNRTRGNRVTHLYLYWASKEQIADYLEEVGQVDRGCDYIALDTVHINEYGGEYSNELWSVVPINELPERMARQVANMLNNGINYCEV